MVITKGDFLVFVQYMPKQLRNFILKTFDKVFLSLPFAIGLILSICMICLIGISEPFTQTFQTKWFLLCLSFVGFVMLYCSVRRLPRLITLYLKGPSNVEHDLDCAEKILDRSLPSEDRSSNLDLLNKVFHRCGYKRNAISQSDKDIFLYERAKFGILGPHIIHLGIAILLIAGIITAWSGDFYDVNIKEGEGIDLKGTDTRLTLEKFSVIPSAQKEMADEYASRLRINRAGRAVEWRTLKVNAPLRVDGFRFYQMRYSFDIEQLDVAVFDQASGDLLKIVPLTVGGRVTLSQLDMDIQVEEFIPDFAIDQQGNVSARSSSIVNPACRISVFSPSGSDQIVHQGWIFRNFIAPHPDEQQASKWKFSIDRIQVRNISGIKVTRNPGEYVTYFGLVILILGSFLSCYRFYRCLVVRLKETNQEGILSLQCFALKAKNMFEFERELKKIKETLRVSFEKITFGNDLK